MVLADNGAAGCVCRTALMMGWCIERFFIRRCTWGGRGGGSGGGSRRDGGRERGCSETVIWFEIMVTIGWIRFL